MTHRILIADDEADIHAVTRLSLKTLKLRDQGVELMFASSGEEAVALMAEYPDIAVILMDVVMENDDAGLQAVQKIRTELGNEMVRILLRTGQPGMAPERQVIDAYDIDGYLSKAELTNQRLYTAVRTALKAFDDLTWLQQHRDTLTYLQQSLLALHSSADLNSQLQTLTETAAAVAHPSELSMLYLELQVPERDEAQQHIFYAGPDGADSETLSAASLAVIEQVLADPTVLQTATVTDFAEGTLMPIFLPEGKGVGFLFTRSQARPDLLAQSLGLLASHAALAIRLQV